MTGYRIQAHATPPEAKPNKAGFPQGTVQVGEVELTGDELKERLDGTAT